MRVPDGTGVSCLQPGSGARPLKCRDRNGVNLRTKVPEWSVVFSVASAQRALSSAT